MDSKINIAGNIAGQINFSMQQNYVPLIRNLVVTNNTTEVLREIDVHVTFEPEFAKEFTYHLAELGAEESKEIPNLKVQLKPEYLFALTEKLVGTIQIVATKGEEILFKFEDEIELLAYDQWSGISIMPEMIAAFVMPNHPKVTELVVKASQILKGWTKSPSFTGYQTQNPEQVKSQMAAIYNALQAEQIVYNNPPASYETIGQRIRLPHQVLSQKMGTCIDLAVLYVTCMEAVGLHPLLCFIEGHAFCGCWLERESFADCAIDDIDAIIKRTEVGATEILLVECTDFVAGELRPFDKATKHGNDHLNQREKFDCVIDISRSRGSGIRPMATTLESSYASYTQSASESIDASLVAPSTLENTYQGKEITQTVELITKQKVWERKLLDFSLRNTLLNFRVTKNAFQILAADLSELEDRLSDGKEFRIMEAPTEFGLTLRDAKMYEIETEKDLIQTIAQKEFESGRIRTFLSENELEKNLKNLYRAAKMSMEENGTNTLFLALGFLRWYESDLSEKARYAPIVLIPVDIVRSRKSKGYVIRSRQEDAQINVTLLEYLKQDHNVTIGGLDPLPEDEHGLDLNLIFHIIRQAIMDKKRWNIDPLAFTGLFSFGQFVMWNDIRNRSKELAENKVVASLIDGKMLWTKEDVSLTEVSNIEDALDEMALPVSADSSQMKAVYAAAKGQSFVLHGPPGTGKSQTITNIIANTLYQGKTVLFVAEKMAALTVVQKRLEAIGLAPFCLELHSNKTNKTSVLSALNRSLEVGRIKSPSEYEVTGNKLHTLRSKLNGIVDGLHSERWYGGSLYDAISTYEKHMEYKAGIVFEPEYLEKLTKEDVTRIKELVHNYEIVIQEIKCYANHPLYTYKGETYSLELRASFEAENREILGIIEEVNQHIQSLADLFQETKLNKERLLLLSDLVKDNATDVITMYELLRAINYSDLVTLLIQFIDTGKEYTALKDGLLGEFDEAVFEYDIDTARLQWNQSEQTWFLPKMLTQNKLLKEIRLYAKNPKVIAKENIVEIHTRLTTLKRLQKQILEAPEMLTSVTSNQYTSLTTNWTKLLASLEKTKSIYALLEHVNASEKQKFLIALQGIENNHVISAEEVVGFIERVALLARTYSLDLTEIYQADHWVETFRTLSEQYCAHISELHNIIMFNQEDHNMREHKLEHVSDAYKKGTILHESCMKSFLCDLHYGLLLLTMKQDERLADFYGKQYDAIVKQYKETIDEFQRLTIQELVARLSAKVPSASIEGAASSELGILKKAIKNNGRMMSLRRLFDQTPTLLRKLAPCMLMSPISVAQYIDPSYEKFDLVIFDEASQLPTSESVGTIARGKNVVIVGDPKQLPPTNFFSSNRVDEENSEQEDLESLLDDCLAISMPEESLQWHYRSRHESLIAYSNMKYYDNKLYTFPSPNDLTSEVKFIPLEGYYDKGKTKQNKAEATAIVNEILRRLKDETLRQDSIGVVTFSSVQQNLIEDMLYEAFRTQPELEEIDRTSVEPIFIKNLENVQGDERDIILFSIGYGPDPEGKVSMNFGPLNRDGGWRRLNVAISRARKSMIVYSVLRPDQIDLNRTRSEGVAGLKGFLEFAMRGKNITVQQEGILAKKTDYIVKEIVASIQEMGYETKYDVGCSSFKVDIGVIHPKYPDRYLLGILVDGENCNDSDTARDRFVLQPGVLCGLGWDIARVWTLDWLDDAQKIKDSLKELIAKRVEAKEDELLEEFENTKKKEPIIFEQEEIVETCSHEYQVCELTFIGNADAFYLPETTVKIRAAMEQIIELEAPINQKLLMKKVLGLWEISRSGSRVEGIYLQELEKLKLQSTMDEERAFLWKKNQISQEYDTYRVESNSGYKRGMDEVPSEEIMNAMKEVLKEQISLSREDLLKETAKKFGYFRSGTVIESTIQYAIQKALEQNKIEAMENGHCRLNTKY